MKNMHGNPRGTETTSVEIGVIAPSTRILIVSFTFPPNKDGVSEAADAMARGFVNEGWQVEVLTHVTTPARQSPTWHGSRIIEYSHTPGLYPDMEIQGYGCGCANFLREGEWDVIIIHAYEQPLRLAIPVLVEVKAAKILVSHGYAALLWEKVPKFPFGLGIWLRRVLDSVKMPRWLPRFDAAVYLSDQSDFRGFYDHRIARITGYGGRRIIPNGVDLGERGTDRAGFRHRNQIADDAFLFVCIANYSPRKDQGFGARAFREAAIPKSVLVFIGSDFNEYSEQYQTEDEKHPNHHGTIIWLEKQSREETLNALAACDAFILSARHEAQPIALLEAMREKKPWIARDAGCIASMEGGLCVKSVSAMAAAMNRLSAEPSLCARLANEGLEAVASRYNRTAYVKAYCDLIEEFLP